MPIDISEDALRAAARGLAREFPWLRVAPVAGDFSRPLDIRVRRGTPSVVYFPGSTIGNLTPEEAHAFLSMSRGVATQDARRRRPEEGPGACCTPPTTTRPGVTAAFNLNLLARINRELGADFDLRRFRHYAFYNPAAGRIEMHLVALEAHTVRLGRHRFRFAAGETIHTENSYKYSPEEFARARRAGGLPRHQGVDRPPRPVRRVRPYRLAPQARRSSSDITGLITQSRGAEGAAGGRGLRGLTGAPRPPSTRQDVDARRPRRCACLLRSSPA